MGVQLKTWEGTEWFGTDFTHAPYWDACDYGHAFGLYFNEEVRIGTDQVLEFLSVYKEGEFLCSFELGAIIPENVEILKLTNVSLLRDLVPKWL